MASANDNTNTPIARGVVLERTCICDDCGSAHVVTGTLKMPRAQSYVIAAIEQLVHRCESDNAYVAPYVAGHNDAIRSVLRLLKDEV